MTIQTYKSRNDESSSFPILLVQPCLLSPSRLSHTLVFSFPLQKCGLFSLTRSVSSLLDFQQHRCLECSVKAFIHSGRKKGTANFF